MKTYLLKPSMTMKTVAPRTPADKAAVQPPALPPRQPLPTAVIDPNKPMLILNAILAGERDPHTLAALKAPRIKASRDTIAKSLHGDWRPEHLFTLKQTHALWQQHQTLIADCDRQIATMLATFDARVDVAAMPLAPQTKTSHKKAQRNEPQFAAREECYRVLGVDLTVVPGFQTPTVLVLLCELGPAFAEKFATANILEAGWDCVRTTGSPAAKENARREEPGGDGPAAVRAVAVAQQRLSGRMLPAMESAARGAQGPYRDGA